VLFSIRYQLGWPFIATYADHRKGEIVSRCPARPARLPKAPEGWRTPRRFARFVRRQHSRQRLGLRRPSAACPRRHEPSSIAHRFLLKPERVGWQTAARISSAFGSPSSKLVAEAVNKLKPGGLVSNSV
jgi:hypothetical protein